MNNVIKVIALAITTMFLASCATDPQLSMPSIFSDNMVLQQNKDVAIWGKAKPGTEINVTGSWGSDATTTADDSGEWRVNLPTIEAGGPYTLSVSAAKTSLTINNVLLGEVWIGSGQSNMEMPLAGWPPNDLVKDADATIAASDIPEIRFFTVVRNTAAEPQDDLSGKWELSSPETAGQFSATAFFFARKLYQELGVPVGIIHSSWGGTPAESWISSDMLAIDADFKAITEQLKEFGPKEKLYTDWLKEHKSLPAASSDNTDPLVGLDLFDEYCASPETAVEQWPVMQLPLYFERSDIGEFDGVVWFRKKLEIPAEWEGQNLTINLGPIDDRDVCYFEGTRVGAHEEGGFHQAVRQYSIPAELVKAGEAVVAVRVLDNQGGGGIYGNPEQLSIHPENNPEASISLAGEWNYMVVGEFKGGQLYCFDPQTADWSERPELSMALSAYTPSALYNAMIAPLVPYSVQGAIWYQGETNVGRANQYMRLKSMLITDWRNKFENEDLAFYYVQLAPWNYSDPEGISSARLREAQRRMMDIPGTGMISTLDIGNVDNIHPAQKLEVGERLALWALAGKYQKELPFSGPLPDQTEIVGKQLRQTFTHATGGLVVNKEVPNQFEIAGADGVFYPAQWKLENDTLVLSSSAVAAPFYLRYAYHNGSQASLFNGVGLPAPSFSTEPEIQD